MKLDGARRHFDDEVKLTRDEMRVSQALELAQTNSFGSELWQKAKTRQTCCFNNQLFYDFLLANYGVPV